MEINGKKVVDAKAPAKIAITEHDAKVGDNKNPSGCAAALAAMRDIKDCIITSSAIVRSWSPRSSVMQ